ncbi:MAG: TerC family protein [Acidobacteriota bacterium]|nr:MAG: TerC family protein [Acidobacteriota bacterium]
MIVVWVGFVALVVVLLVLDLVVVHRKPHAISAAEAFAWTGFWIALALVFNAGVYVFYEHHWFGIGLEIGHPVGGRQAALEFFTGYVIEKSLSLDNIFVIAMILAYFRVPRAFQHRLLCWGIFGAIVLRGAMIAAGVALIERFSWMVYVFGALLIVTAAKMAVVRHDNVEPERNLLVRLTRRFYPVSPEYDGTRFFTRLNGQWAATPMLLALFVVETSDVLFAVDSIPAIFAVTRDPFIVYTSNVFAILGLRSLYFALAAVMEKFRYIKASLVFVLVFVGAKMILSHHIKLPVTFSLAVIAIILLFGLLASLIGARRDTAHLRSPTTNH